MLNGRVESSSREAKALLVLGLAAAAGVDKVCTIFVCVIAQALPTPALAARSSTKITLASTLSTL